MDFNINRFIEAQNENDSFSEIISELEKGEFNEESVSLFFPRMKGLNNGERDDFFTFGSVYEASVFLADSELYNRYFDICKTLYNYNYNVDIESVMGSDDKVDELHASVTLMYLFKEAELFNDILNCFFNGDLHRETQQLYENEIQEFIEDLWEVNKARYYERAYFDDGCTESDDMTLEERYSSFLDMALKGYSVTYLVRKYLYNHSDYFDHYRTTNTESTLFHAAHRLWLDTAVWLDEQTDPSPFTEYASLFPKEYWDLDEHTTWETVAYRFDSLIKFILNHENLKTFAQNLIDRYTTLRK